MFRRDLWKLTFCPIWVVLIKCLHLPHYKLQPQPPGCHSIACAVIQWPGALSTEGHSIARYGPPCRAPRWQVPCSKTYSLSMALPWSVPCHTTGWAPAMWPRSQEQPGYMVSDPEIHSHIHWNPRRLIRLLITRNSLAIMLSALHVYRESVITQHHYERRSRKE